MKIHQTTGRGVFVRLGGAALLAGVLLWANRSETVQPVLQISKTPSNTFQITITNGVSTNNYEIYRRSFLDPLYPWGEATTGTMGQTTFYVTGGLQQLSFFRAAVGSDWDLDGAPNTRDAQPTNGSIGALRITIDAPPQGDIIQ